MYSRDLIIDRTAAVIKELEAASVHGLERFQSRLQRAVDDEELLDILAQGRFALILSYRGFESIEIEPSQQGPDIRLTFEGIRIFLEVRRLRPKEEDYRLAESGGPLWISPEKDNTVRDKVGNKNPQLVSGEINLVVIWSNTMKCGYPEIQEAFKSMSKVIATGLYKKLSGLILVEDHKIDLSLPELIYLFINDMADKPMASKFIVRFTPICRHVNTIQEASS